MTEVDRPHRLLLAACSSSGALSLPQYLMFLKRLDEPIEIHVIMSDNAAHLLPPESLAPFCDEVVAPGPYFQGTSVGHVGYSDWSDLMIIAPATADIMVRVAMGLADKPIALLASAHQAPIMLFPNMNKYMWDKPAMGRAVQQLEDDGHLVMEPVWANAFATAAGRFEDGYILPPPSQFAQIVLAELRSRRKAADDQSVPPA